MRLTIIAATGGIGQQLVERAVASGHEVTAVVRGDARPAGARVVVRADLATAGADELRAAVDGADGVLSGLGPRTRADAGVAATGTAAIVSAMRTTSARRLVVVSAAPVATVASPGRPDPPKHDPGEGVFMRNVLSPVMRAVLGGAYADLAVMEDELRQSGLEWTAVRPPRLTNGPLTKRYRTALGENLRRGMSISRADVAHFMLAALEQSSTIGRTVGIAY